MENSILYMIMLYFFIGLDFFFSEYLEILDAVIFENRCFTLSLRKKENKSCFQVMLVNLIL